MRKLFWVFLSGAAFLAGCASTYVEPVSGPMAKLRVRSAGPVTHYTWIHTFEKPNCQGKQLMGEIGNRGTHPATVPSAHNPKGMIGSAVTPDPNIIEQIIPAKQTTILFTQHGPHSAINNLTCKLAVSFTAEAGAEYEIKYGYSSMQCFASADRLRLIDGKVVREPVQDARNMDDCISFFW